MLCFCYTDVLRGSAQTDGVRLNAILTPKAGNQLWGIPVPLLGGERTVPMPRADHAVRLAAAQGYELPGLPVAVKLLLDTGLQCAWDVATGPRPSCLGDGHQRDGAGSGWGCMGLTSSLAREGARTQHASTRGTAKRL
jgi:hypothetical protein